MAKLPWYHRGLHFQCTECGQCCTGAPGIVWVEEEEIQAIADYLRIPIEECVMRFIRYDGKRYALKEKVGSYDCIFLKDKRCFIYKVRPNQCRTFPFWPDFLSSPETWEEAKACCEGINDQAPRFSMDEINALLA